MATIINNPGNSERSDSTVSAMILAIAFLVAVVLFFIYALPAIRDSNSAPQNGKIDVNIKLPATSPVPTP
ncbi:MAG: hypothetical protein Q7S34_04180 [bacterium]|nr:hypothetical protein [bacterium]